MQGSADGGEINQLVQTAPTFAAQSFYHLVGRRNRERHHEKESGHADGNERTFYDIAGNRRQMKETIKRDVSHQVQKAIEKRKKPDHAAKLNQPIRAGHGSHRRDSERKREKNERQHTGGASHKLERIRAYLFAINVPEQQRQRHQAVDKKKEF